MKYLFFVIFFYTTLMSSQTKRDDSFYTSKNVSISYNYRIGNVVNKKVQLLEIGVNKSIYGGKHGGGGELGFGFELFLGAEQFIIGPKIKGIINYQGLILGTELISYTSFYNSSLRLVPVIGFGGEKFKITYNPQVILTNKDFTSLNKGSINFNVNIRLSRKKKQSKQL